jgi:2-amino-4-hydroxy-6-hydroxymethyldihydropteridine diphosphokinase
MKGIVQHNGRLPTFRYGPRVIDLDILLYEDQVIDNPFYSTAPAPA